ncbi:hypothetical protein [Escherichia phage IME08]|uniref:Uncharacterized protein 30.4 n=1 Tax=Escherichia phage IME08 TaxID=698728 RepID=D7RMK8_9CAUD|nr:hypothetical protein IME08_gp194 [Escherichia phage IME08]ADI55524.1 hypothetical protein [Escherichia phage IME08]
MVKKLIQKLLGTEMVEVTYRVTDGSPWARNIEPYTKTIKMLKSDGGLSIKDRLPSYGHWANVDVVSVKDV